MTSPLLVGRQELPKAPVEIQDAVELYARQSRGGHGVIHFVPSAMPFKQNGRTICYGTWMIRFTLRPEDKRLQLVKTGKASAEEVTEDVWLRDATGTPFDIHQLGVGGVLSHLEKGNMWSGRGEFSSLTEQLQKVRQQNEAAQEKHRADQKDAAKATARDKRRSLLKIPFLTVNADLKGSQTVVNSADGASSHAAARPPQVKEQ